MRNSREKCEKESYGLSIGGGVVVAREFRPFGTVLGLRNSALDPPLSEKPG